MLSFTISCRQRLHTHLPVGAKKVNLQLYPVSKTFYQHFSHGSLKKLWLQIHTSGFILDDRGMAAHVVAFVTCITEQHGILSINNKVITEPVRTTVGNSRDRPHPRTDSRSCSQCTAMGNDGHVWPNRLSNPCKMGALKLK